MDLAAFAAALSIAGETQGAAIEVSLGGVEIAAEGGEVGVAVAGGAFEVSLDGRRLPAACALNLAQGARLSLRAGESGAFAYVAPFARFDLAPVLGSLATHTRARLGGLEGRMLRAEDILPLCDARAGPPEPMTLVAPWLDRADAKIRVMLGPQQDFFSQETLDLFLSSRWRLAARSDRMAYALDGPRLQHLFGHDIVSDGLAFGAIQAPGDGAPLVLMADCQPTGGYPKIAHVIGADLGALAQRRPGDEIMFQRVSHGGAVEARRALAERIGAGATLAPIIRRDFSSEFLLAQNLVSGVVNPEEMHEACPSAVSIHLEVHQPAKRAQPRPPS